MVEHLKYRVEKELISSIAHLRLVGDYTGERVKSDAMRQHKNTCSDRSCGPTYSKATLLYSYSIVCVITCCQGTYTPDRRPPARQGALLPQTGSHSHAESPTYPVRQISEQVGDQWSTPCGQKLEIFCCRTEQLSESLTRVQCRSRCIEQRNNKL